MVTGFLLVAMISLTAQSQESIVDTAKKKGCLVPTVKSDLIYMSTKGAMIWDDKLNYTTFEGHESDSLYGFIETTDFRAVLFIGTPVNQVVIYGLGENYSVKIEVEIVNISKLNEAVGVYYQHSKKITVYQPVD